MILRVKRTATKLAKLNPLKIHVIPPGKSNSNPIRLVVSSQRLIRGSHRGRGQFLVRFLPHRRDNILIIQRTRHKPTTKQNNEDNKLRQPSGY